MKRKLLVGALASSVAVGGTVGATTFSDSITADNKSKVSVKSEAESDFEFNMNKLIGVEELQDIVLNEVQGTIEEVELEFNNNQQSYFEVEVHNESEEYVVHVNAYTGQVMKVQNKEKNVQKNLEGDVQATVDQKADVKSDNNQEASKSKVESKTNSNEEVSVQSEENNETNQTIISQEKAIKSALEVASGKVAEVELNDEDDQAFYQIELKGAIKSEIKVDAYTGAILEVDLD